MGQIYIPVINWFLLAVSLVFVCTISSMDEIGNAYGNYFISKSLFHLHGFFKIFSHICIKYLSIVSNAKSLV
jgi:K+ transporter